MHTYRNFSEAELLCLQKCFVDLKTHIFASHCVVKFIQSSYLIVSSSHAYQNISHGNVKQMTIYNQNSAPRSMILL